MYNIELVKYAMDNNISIGFDSCSASNFAQIIKEEYVAVMQELQELPPIELTPRPGAGYDCAQVTGQHAQDLANACAALHMLKDKVGAMEGGDNTPLPEFCNCESVRRLM